MTSGTLNVSSPAETIQIGGDCACDALPSVRSVLPDQIYGATRATASKPSPCSIARPISA